MDRRRCVSFSEADVNHEPHVKLTEATEPTGEATLAEPSRESARAERAQGRARGQRLGERLRQLRIQEGLTQTDLAGERFSKEYVSQIERGKTRPTQETIDWLAARLGVDAGFLGSGVSADERGRVEALLARADALSEDRRFDEAVAEYGKARAAVAATGSPELQARAVAGEGWALLHAGEVRKALDRLGEARSLVEAPGFSDLDRANVLF